MSSCYQITVVHYNNYSQAFDIIPTLVGNKIVDHLDVVGASPVGYKVSLHFSHQNVVANNGFQHFFDDQYSKWLTGYSVKYDNSWRYDPKNMWQQNSHISHIYSSIDPAIWLRIFARWI